MQYRPEIDGLRTIAVVSVILYHAKFYLGDIELLSGGFIGVDVFFVISGYLISRIILEEIAETGSLSIANFYERRVRRIFPALVLVILCTALVVPFVSTEGARSEFQWSAVAAILSVSNFFFLFTATDYDAGSSLLMPLLHTWSLGVEEQFYLVLPLMLFLCRGLSARATAVLILGLLLGSLAWAELTTHDRGDFAFFFPVTRFWEMFVGTLAAMVHISMARGGGSMAGRSALAWLGLVAVLSSLVMFSESTAHPGVVTMIPVLGIALVLVFADAKSGPGAILATGPFLWIGKRSYSAYLWHFPIFALVRQAAGEPTVMLKVVIILVTFLLSALSYRYVEQPFRDRRRTSGRVLATRLTGGLAAIVLAFLVMPGSQTSRASATQSTALDMSFDIPAMNGLMRDFANAKTAFAFPERTNVLVMGNSHTRNIFGALEQNQAGWPGAEFLARAIQISCFDPGKPENREIAQRYLASPQYKEADVVLITSRYEHKNRCERGKMARDFFRDTAGLTALLERVKRDGKAVVVFGPIPEIRGDRPGASFYDPLMQMNLSEGTDADALDDLVLAQNKRAFGLRVDTSDLAAEIRQVAERHGVPYVSLDQLMCSDADQTCMALTPSFKRAYTDGHHLTKEGALHLGQRFVEDGLFDTLFE